MPLSSLKRIQPTVLKKSNIAKTHKNALKKIVVPSELGANVTSFVILTQLVLEKILKDFPQATVPPSEQTCLTPTQGTSPSNLQYL